MPANTKSITVSLDPYSLDLLKALAANEDRSRSYIVAVALEAFARGTDVPGTGLDHEIRDALAEKHGIGSRRDAVRAVVEGD